MKTVIWSCNRSPTNLQLEKYLYTKHFKEGPYFILHVERNLENKSKLICEEIKKLNRGVPVKEKLKFFISNCLWSFLPINRIFFSCMNSMPKDVLKHFPEPGPEMMNGYICPMYDDMVSQIRNCARGRNVFLSFTVHEFKVEADNFGTKLSEAYFVDYLFVIVGVLDLTGNEVQRKFILKAKQLLVDSTDVLSNDIFKKEFFDCLKLLWPHDDYLTQARNYLAYLITEPELEMNQLVQEIQRSSQLDFTHIFYCDGLLFRIEKEIRRKFPDVVNVIEYVRCQWTETIGFRDAYISISPNYCPPESFYESAQFYHDHLEKIRNGLLNSHTPKLKDARQAMSDSEFSKRIDEFAQHSKLLQALARAYSSDLHQFSYSVCTLLEDVKMANRIYSSQGYKQLVESKLGGPDHVAKYVNSGDYQLLMALIEKLVSDTPHRLISSSDVTKYYLVKTIADGRFLTKPVPKDRWVSFRGTKQLEKCFPAFHSLFLQHKSPIMWDNLDIFSVVYCFIESENSQLFH